ncbi:conserved Plasmodium protein, unknown function [Plasmodium ovale]|uniref:Uncharacterized protein n=1 Tax=Plasmodium ovale TaxID=36330 RepID=A0A1D3TIW9_PLAOA|nr:conserved Plasmodium protein, unknown function [Plasmodium ovale]
MMLNYIFYNNSSKYENKIERVKKDELNSFQSCIKNVSITFILFGSIFIIINLLINLFFIGNWKFPNVYKLFSITSGLWLVIIVVQVLTFLFPSTFFESSTQLFLNSEKRPKAVEWNPFTTGIFLSNVVAFSCMSIASFYGIFSYIVDSFNVTNGRMVSTTIFTFSLNLMFLLLQFLYVLLKIHRIKPIEFGSYFPLFLPGFACLLESFTVNVKSKIREGLLNKKNKKKKQKQKMKDHRMHQDEHLFLIN